MVSYRISGTICEEETGRPLSDLIVRAYDKDALLDDLVGYTTTREDGTFEIRYSERDFKDWVERSPDLYLLVYDARGAHLLHDTRDRIRRNAGTDEIFQLQISGTRLMPR